MKKSLLIILCTLMSLMSWAQNRADGTAEPYAVLTDNQDVISQDSTGITYGQTLTFYYNDQKEANNGMSVGPFDNYGNVSWYANSGTITKVVFDESFANCTSLTSTAYWFRGMSALTTIEGISNLKTDNVTDMSFMFSGCSLRDLDLSNLNTENVTDMRSMFSDCYGLTSLDVSGFKTDNVTAMSEMFYSCFRLTSLDLSGFKTDNVTSMSGMFSGCYGLTSLDVSHFNTANVKYMGDMFSGCYGLTSLDLSGFNTANVTDMRGVFSGCYGLTSLDLSGFNTANVWTMHEMFNGCFRLTSLDVTGFKTDNVTDMRLMFNRCSGLTSLDVSSFNTENVNNMALMFGDCSSLTSLDLSNFNTANVINMSCMFLGCSGLTSFDVSNFNTGNVVDMSGMFYGCSALKTIYAGSEWSINKDNVGSQMFFNCTNLVGGAGTVYDANHIDHTYARIDGGPNSTTPGYFTDKDATSKVATPTFSWNEHTLTVSSATEGATIVYNNLKENPVMVEGEGILLYQTYTYTDPLTIIENAELLFWAQKDGMANSDSITLNYPYTAWVALTDTLTKAKGIYDLALNNANVPDQMKSELASAISVGDSIYQVRNSSVDEIQSVTNRISVIANEVASLISAEDEPYAVLSENNTVVTFYYDDQKTARGGVDINNSYTNHYSSAKTVVFDASFANYRPESTAYWFNGLKDLETFIGLEYLNTSNVTSFKNMFKGCRSLKNLDLSGFDASKVTDMKQMFEDCSSLKNLNLRNFNTDSATNMGDMFCACSSLESLDLSSFNTVNVTKMSYMFAYCSSLKTLGLSSFNTANVTNMEGMFHKDSLLTTIYVGESWSTANVSSEEHDEAKGTMFQGCIALVGGAGTPYDSTHVDYTYAHIDEGESNPGYFTKGGAQGPSVTVVAPEFRFEGDNLTMSTTTQNASIFYKMAELPSMDDAVVESVKNSLVVTPDGQQSTYYEHPFELKMAAVVKAIAVVDNATGTVVSDTTTMVYDYEAWVNLKAAVTSGVDLYDRAKGNPNVDAQLLEDLQWALNEGDMIYNQRAQMDSFEATHFTKRINELCAQIEAQMAAEDEPYAVLSDNNTKLTFYYDKQKASRGGMSVGPFGNDKVSDWYSSARNTITSVVFDDSFANCTSLTSTAYWFEALRNLTTISGIGNLKTDNVTDMSNMFLFCESLTSLDVAGFKTSNVVNMENMFYGCSSLTSLDVSNFNTSNVTNMDMMFQMCSGLTSLDVSNFNTSSVTRMLQMFCQCSSLTKLTLGNFNTDKVTVMSGLLNGCSSLTEIDLSSLNTSSVESLFLMFDGCTSLKTLDLSNFNTARVTNMVQMFRNCTDLTTIYVGSGWTTSEVTNSDGMFTDCTSLVGGAGTVYDANHFDHTYAHIDEGASNPGYFTRSGDSPWVDPTEKVETPYFRMESDYNNEVMIQTDTDEAEIFYTQNSRMIQGNDTDFGFGDRNLNWKVSGSNSSYQVTSGGYNNSYCLKLTSATASTFGSAQAGYKFVSALTKDTYYTLHFKARSESGRGQLQVFCQNDTIDNTRSMVDTMAIGSELADYEVTFKIQNEITNQVVLNFGAVADTYYIDNVLFGAVVSDTTNQKRTRYEQPINLREGATIKAVATKQGMLDSSPAVLDYFYDGWMNLRDVYEMAKAIPYDCYGDPNVPLQMIKEVEAWVAERYSRLWDRRGREHVDDTELLETYEDMRFILDELYRMKSGFTVDGVSYHAVDSTQVEVIPSLESYYRGAITVPATVHYNDIDFRVTTVTQNAFHSEYLTAIIWNAGFALTATDLQSSQNPNLLLYVTEASMAPTDRDNVVINGFAKNIRLSEGGDFYCPQAFTAEAISYTREFKQQTQIGVSRGWETIALPFTVQTITHEQRGVIAPFGNTASNTHFWLRRLTSNGLQAVPTIEANTAYLISMPNSEEYIADYNLSGRVTFSAENATVPMTEVVKDESADYVMTPCFTNAAAKQGIYVLNVGEERNGYPEGSIFESNYRALLPFQAYVEHKGSNPAPPRFIISSMGGEGTTGIETIGNGQLTMDNWYDLNGRKLQGKPAMKGVYIHNGKKKIIK